MPNPIPTDSTRRASASASDTKPPEGARSRGVVATTKPSEFGRFRECLETRPAEGPNALGRGLPNTPGPEMHASPRDARTKRRELDVAFQVEPSILLPPSVRPQRPAPAAGASSDSVALIERFVESIRVGRVGAAGHAARIRVATSASRSSEDAEVRIVVEEGRVVASIRSDDSAAAESLRARIAEQLSNRGIDAEVSVSG